MLKRVFIIESIRRLNIDVSKASHFGEVTYLFDENARRCSLFQHDEFGRHVLRRLIECNFNPLIDSICIVGTMLTIAISLAAIAQSYDEFNMLLFNSVENSYVQRTFNKQDWKGQSNEKSYSTVERNY